MHELATFKDLLHEDHCHEQTNHSNNETEGEDEQLGLLHRADKGFLVVEGTNTTGSVLGSVLSIVHSTLGGHSILSDVNSILEGFSRLLPPLVPLQIKPHLLEVVFDMLWPLIIDPVNNCHWSSSIYTKSYGQATDVTHEI